MRTEGKKSQTLKGGNKQKCREDRWRLPRCLSILPFLVLISAWASAASLIYCSVFKEITGFFFFFFLVTNRNIKAIFEARNPSLMHRNKHSGWMWPDLNTGVSTRNQPRCLQLAFLVSTGLKIWLRVGQVSLKGSWAYSCYSGYVAPDSSTETNCHRYTEISLLLEHYFTLTMDWWMMAAVYRSTR